ncbi:hypothetical protein PUN28_005214 [Cardiocondyla obscurior]|uniref:Uncharacterized protein n=1 Tax=Cardiocondyla obscurior TaxID=286306 RepID=A0AAW2GES3_9HYME
MVGARVPRIDRQSPVTRWFDGYGDAGNEDEDRTADQPLAWRSDGIKIDGDPCALIVAEVKTSYAKHFCEGGRECGIMLGTS